MENEVIIETYTDIVAGVEDGGAVVLKTFKANPFDIIKVLEKTFNTFEPDVDAHAKINRDIQLFLREQLIVLSKKIAKGDSTVDEQSEYGVLLKKLKGK